MNNKNTIFNFMGRLPTFSGHMQRLELSLNIWSINNSLSLLASVAFMLVMEMRQQVCRLLKSRLTNSLKPPDCSSITCRKMTVGGGQAEAEGVEGKKGGEIRGRGEGREGGRRLMRPERRRGVVYCGEEEKGGRHAVTSLRV